MRELYRRILNSAYTANEIRDLQSRQQDLYRFRGAIAPTATIRASALTPDVEDGEATLRLYDPIDSWGGAWGVSAKEFAEALDQIPKDTSTIRLHINSPGGEVWEGIAIMNLLRAHPARVVAVVDGLAASAASFIACAADETIMGKNTQLMIHDAWGLCVGNAADMRVIAGRLDQISDNIAEVYHDKAGATREFWRDAMLAETWYSAGEAVEAGLADSVAGEQQAESNRFDLSVFTFAGRDAAPDPAIPGGTETDARSSEGVAPPVPRLRLAERLAASAKRHEQKL